MSPSDQWEDVQGHFLDHMDEINNDLRAAGLPTLGVAATKTKIDLATPDSSPELVAVEPVAKVDDLLADSAIGAEENQPTISDLVLETKKLEVGSEPVSESLVVP